MRAILEIDLPESCIKCSMYYKKIHYVDTHYMCAALNKELPYSRKAGTRRYSGCPIQYIDRIDREESKITYIAYTTMEDKILGMEDKEMGIEP